MAVAIHISKNEDSERISNNVDNSSALPDITAGFVTPLKFTTNEFIE